MCALSTSQMEYRFFFLFTPSIGVAFYDPVQQTIEMVQVSLVDSVELFLTDGGYLVLC